MLEVKNYKQIHSLGGAAAVLVTMGEIKYLCLKTFERASHGFSDGTVKNIFHPPGFEPMTFSHFLRSQKANYN